MEESLNSCLILFELLGLQYFSLVHDNLTDRPTSFRTAFLAIILTLTTAIITKCITQHISLTDKEVVNAKNVLMYAIQHSMTVGFILVAYTSLIQSYTSTQKVKKFFSNTKDIVRLVHKEFNIKVNFKQIKREACKKILVMIIFFVTAHLTMTFLVVQSLRMTIGMIILMLPIFFILVIVYKFIFYVDIINHQLMSLEKMVGDIFKSQPLKIFDDFHVHMTTVEPAKSSEDPMKKLQAARKIYNLIYDNGLLINSSNGLTIMIMLLCIVTTLTASGYEIFVIVVGDLPMHQIPGKWQSEF